MGSSVNMAPSWRKKQPATRFNAIVIACLGIAVCLFAAESIRQAIRVEDFRATNGRVIESEVIRAGRSYQPRIAYHYSVEGRDYENDVVDPVHPRGTEAWADDAAGRYAPGADLVVFYNPNDPSDSVLVKSQPGGWLFTEVLMFLIGLGMLLLGVIGVHVLRLKEPR